MKRRIDYIEISKTVLEQMYYEQGLKQREIAAYFGVSTKTIGNRMSEYGLATRSHDDYVYINIPKAELERLYIQENRAAPEIAVLYGCATSVIYDRMKEHGIAVKSGGWDKVKRIVPPERLQWSPKFAYIVGLIASDGNLQLDSNEVRIASTDREIADMYCSALGLRPHDISATAWPDPNAIEVYMRIERRPPYKEQYHVIFSDYVYRARLEAIGLTPNKSKTLGPLAIPDEYFRDFLRGEFDGDGCWSGERHARRKYALGIFTSGSRVYLDWLHETIQRIVGIKGHIYKIDLRFEGKHAEKLGEFMYYAPDLPCLSRKRNKWLNVIVQQS